MIDRRFLRSWFQLPWFKEHVGQNSRSCQTSFNREDLEDLTIRVPPLAEQRRIVAKVDALLARVNAARDRLEKVLLLLKRFRQSVLAKAFRGELGPTEADLASREGRTYQSAAQLLGKPEEEAGDELPEGWAQSTLGRLLEGGLFTDGDWVESKDQDPPGEVRLVQLADVGDGVFRNRSRRHHENT